MGPLVEDSVAVICRDVVDTGSMGGQSGTARRRQTAVNTDMSQKYKTFCQTDRQTKYQTRKTKKIILNMHMHNTDIHMYIRTNILVMRTCYSLDLNCHMFFICI